VGRPRTCKDRRLVPEEPAAVSEARAADSPTGPCSTGRLLRPGAEGEGRSQM
jgi:hypothetical protein